MKIDESEKKYEETSRISEERLKKATEAESKIVNLNNAIERSYFVEVFRDMSIYLL